MKESLEELAGLYVFDQLHGDERATFEARLIREPELAEFVRALESGLANGIRALPPHEPPIGTLARIEERIEAQRARPAVAPSSAPVFRWSVFARWGLASLIAISLTTLAVQSLRHSNGRPVVIFVALDSNRNTFAELPLGESGRNSDARFIQLASLAENLWGNPHDLPVKFASTSGDNRGYALFDPSSRQGFIAIEQLPVVNKNQRYHLWIVDPADGRVCDAGVLPLAGMNRGLYSFRLETMDGPKSDRPNFFITVEENNPASPPAQPRGKVVLGRRSI